MDLECNISENIQQGKVNKKDACVKFYDETKPLYKETDATEVGLGAALLQTRSGKSYPRDEVQYKSIFRPIAFAGKSLSSTEKRYSNGEALGILYWLEKFHHYCFVREGSIVIDHRQRYSSTFPKTQQQRKNAEIPDMQSNIDAIQTMTNIPDCMTTYKLQQAMSQGKYQQCLKEHIIQGWSERNTTRHENILDFLRLHGSDWWSYSEREAYSNTRIITNAGTETAPC